MYTEVVNPKAGAIRLRELLGADCEYFTDEDLQNIVMVCSGMLDRAVVKCLLGMIQKAKDARDSETVLTARNLLNRFEAGLVEV